MLLLTLGACFMAGSGKDDGGGYSAGDQAAESEPPWREPVDAGCDDTDPTVLYVSPDDSNSMSSPVLMRTLAERRGWLTRAPLRTYEFFNYYGFAYPPAAEGELTVTAALRALDAEAGSYELQVGIGTPARAPADRAPANLVFSIDASGSMAGDSIDRVHQLGRAVAGQLRAGDVVSVVTWDTTQSVVLESYLVDGPDDPEVLGAFGSITAGGSTDLHAGLTAAYELALADFSPDRINRVVLVSDGGANVGVTDVDTIAELAGGEDEAGIYLVGVGTGEETSYNDALMDAVTDAGRGAAVYLPDADEVERMFGDRFLETFDIAARDVQVRLDLPPGFSIDRFSGEEYSTDPADVQPQNAAPNDTIVLYQTISTCVPEAVGATSELTVTVTWRDPVTYEERATTVAYSFGTLLGADDPLLAKGRALYLYVDLLAAIQDDEPSPDAREAFEAAYTHATLLNPDDPDLAELRAVVNAL